MSSLGHCGKFSISNYHSLVLPYTATILILSKVITKLLTKGVDPNKGNNNGTIAVQRGRP